ncbi:MAG: DNA-3-methyladenine glycosylase [Salaquimonas sp.]
MKISNSSHIQKGVSHLVETHEVFQRLLPHCGEIPLRLSTADYEGLATIIISQQVSRASAAAITARLKEFVTPLTAETFLNAGEDCWRQAGLSRPKQRTLRAVSEAVIDKQIHLGSLCELGPEEAMAQLTAIKGIGPWTAEIYLMFCAGHRDIFPAGDLALQESIKLALELDTRPDEKTCRAISADWAPWRSVAARILWDYYRVVKRDAMPVS